MTERLYYCDSYLKEFQARVLRTEENGTRVYLDRTAFYPSSGGQPADRGTLGGAPVVDVLEEGDLIAHVTAAPVEAREVRGCVDWRRRFDHMQQHTGQHVLSAVLVELFGLETVSFHLGAESSTIDVNAQALTADQVVAAEERANEIVFENRPVTVGFEDADQAADLRKPSERQGTLRIVSIAGLDRSACGGTHVRATGEIGPILIRKLDKIRGILRLEFLCGLRALRQARADFEALSAIARALSAAAAETPGLVAALIERSQQAEKSCRKLSIQLAKVRGKELYENTPAQPDGARRLMRRQPTGAIDDELRALAQSFTAQPQAVFTAIIEEPPAVLLAVSKDAQVNAGELLKNALTKAGGRGGGNPQLAQGSVPDRVALDRLCEELRAARLL